jgi:guanylate kinase
MAGGRKAKRKGAARKSRRVTRAIARRGLMLVLSSPSGAGKTTLSRMLLKADKSVELSVSVTTRPKRAGEKHGRDYFFIQKPQFEKMVAKDELLEWAEVFGNLYGTPRAPVEKALAAGRDVLFDIDWQGTQQLRDNDNVKTDVATIFVLPPSAIDLERRLRTRAQDSDAVIASRMAKAADEVTHWAEYDYVIVNKDVEQAFFEVRAILAAERLKRARQTGLTEFVRGLQSKL